MNGISNVSKKKVDIIFTITLFFTLFYSNKYKNKTIYFIPGEIKGTHAQAFTSFTKKRYKFLCQSLVKDSTHDLEGRKSFYYY